MRAATPLSPNGVTPYYHRAHASLDGVDVTMQCIEADDERGYVLLLARDPETNKIILNDAKTGPVVEHLDGFVVVTYTPPLTEAEKALILAYDAEPSS